MGYDEYVLKTKNGKVFRGLLTTNNLKGVALDAPGGVVWVDRDKVADLFPVDSVPAVTR